jgi:hypothetical protein
VQGVLLPQTSLVPSLPDIAQQFSSMECNAKAQRGKDARLPVKRIKMFAPSHLCVFALENPSTSKPTSASANGATSSASRWLGEE